MIVIMLLAVLLCASGVMGGVASREGEMTAAGKRMGGGEGDREEEGRLEGGGKWTGKEDIRVKKEKIVEW